ncbi:MAG: hypothetical protein Q4P15_07140, partial [Propionibacteriaceae bacterium]|nr:hypothetical protein [Propionibacteriaceae bacterium]
MDSIMWLWLVIAAVVLIVIIVIAVVVARSKGQVRNRERATELRTHAAQDADLLDSRRERTEDLESQANAARQRAMTESDKADALRVQAGERDEEAARASEKAEILDDEATHSREALDEAVEERDEALREADRRDPDVHTDRHGNRIDDAKDEEDVFEIPEDKDDVLVSPEDDDEVLVIPEDERLDIGDDYSGDEFAEPDAEYIDPVEHDRMDHVRDIVPVDDTPVMEEPEDEVTAGGATSYEPRDEPAVVSPTPARRMAESPSDEILEAGTAEDPSASADPVVDPYGSPVAGTDKSAATPETALGDDDLQHDDQGRRLDP